MKKILFLFIIIISATASGQKNVYQSEKFETLSKTHKTLAIIPFLATLELDDDRGLGEAQLESLEKQEGYAVQDALSVEFQDIKNTNAILARNSINIDNIDIYTAQELCDILGVDGIISGNLTLSALISKGVPEDSFGIFDIFRGKSDYGKRHHPEVRKKYPRHYRRHDAEAGP